jgi:hypothetical protein
MSDVTRRRRVDPNGATSVAGNAWLGSIALLTVNKEATSMDVGVELAVGILLHDSPKQLELRDAGFPSTFSSRRQPTLLHTLLIARDGNSISE